MRNTAPSFEEETDAVCRCAADQAARDFPYTHVGEMRPYQYHFFSKRWYIEVDVHHSNPEEGSATVLYRIWRRTPQSAMTAMKVDIRERAEERPTEQEEEHL